MKTTIKINDKAVEIELTAEQVEAIKKASEKITDRIKTYEDACKVFGIDPSKIMLTYSDQLSVKDANSIVAFAKLQTIVKALNEGWQPDWSNVNQPKYYPWFKWVGSGAGFSCHVYICGYTHSTVGSRLVFKSSELAEYAGKQFNHLYNDLLSL